MFCIKEDDGNMDETKQNDTTDRGQTGSLRIPGLDEGAVTDIICAAGHAYQVVYAQESTWVLYLRCTTIDGNHHSILRVILRPSGTPRGGRWTGDAKWTGSAKFFPRRDPDTLQ